MPKNLRYTEQQWAEQCAARDRWRNDQRGMADAATGTKAGLLHGEPVARATDAASPTLTSGQTKGEAQTRSCSAAEPLTARCGAGGSPLTLNAGKVPASLPPLAAVGASTGTPLERDVMADCAKALRAHPRVVWFERINTGAYKTRAGHYVRYGFPGCSDFMGQLTDGRILCVEVKAPGKTPTAEQIEFLGRVTRAGGTGFVAWSAADIARGLGGQPEAA